MIDIALITTNWSSERITILDKTVGLLSGKFNKKVMSVDILPNGKIPIEYFNKYEGWTIVSGQGGSPSGMVLNQIRALEECSSEWILAMEDDAWIYGIPDVNLLEKHKIDWLCFNCHFNDDVSIIKDYINNYNNYIIEENHILLKKQIEICDKWLLTFPASITRKSILLNLHKKAFEIAKGYSIEEGLSIAWKASNYKDIAVYLNSDILNQINKNNSLDLHKYAMMGYWNNDEATRHESINNKSSIWYA